jgi:hypothetical protein
VTVLWVLWIVFCCVAALASIFRPKGEAAKVTSIVTSLGAATFFVWLSDGRLAAFIVLGVALALPLLVGFVRRHAPKDAARPSLALVARRVLVPALVFGALIGVGIELGGRLSGATFVIWRACAGGALVLAGGAAFLVWSARSASRAE